MKNVHSVLLVILCEEKYFDHFICTGNTSADTTTLIPVVCRCVLQFCSIHVCTAVKLVEGHAGERCENHLWEIKSKAIL